MLLYVKAIREGNSQLYVTDDGCPIVGGYLYTFET